MATWLADGKQGMSRCLVGNGAGSIFLTPTTAAKAGVGHDKSSVQVGNIHGGVKTAVDGEELGADLIDITGVFADAYFDRTRGLHVSSALSDADRAQRQFEGQTSEASRKKTDSYS